MDYLAIRHIHITSVVLSGVLFFVRGVWMMRNASMLNRRWVKIAPHCIDTVLLASAVTMAIWSSQYPFVQTWLTVKVIALAGYIFLGSLALKRGKTKKVRISAFVAALLTYLYIVGVALTKRATLF